MQMRVTSEHTVVTSALIEHSVVIFSTVPFEITKDQKTVADRENKQKNPKSPPTLSSTWPKCLFLQVHTSNILGLPKLAQLKVNF